MKCLSELVLQRYAAGQASVDEIIEVDGHAADCDACLTRLRAWEHALAAISSWEPMPQVEPVARVAADRAAAQNPGPVPVAAETPTISPPHLPQPRADAGRSSAGNERFLAWFRGWFAAKPGFGFGIAAGVALAVIVAVLRPSSPDFVLAITDSNGPAGITEQGALVLAAGSEVPPAQAEAIRLLLTAGEVPLAPDVAALAGSLNSEVVVLGTAAEEAGQPVLRFPVSTAVPGPRPRFQWNKVDGAVVYTVLLTGADDSLIWEIETETNSIDYPSDQPDLERGRVYTWQVETTTVAGELRIAQSRKFLVLPEAASDAVRVTREQFGDSALVMAAVYGQYGLNEDMERALLALRSLNPGNTNIIRMIQRIKQPLDRN